MGFLVTRTSIVSGGGSTFTALQRFTADNMTTGAVPSGTGIAFSKYGLGYGTVVQTSVKRATKSKAIANIIQAGTSGFPADGETPAGNGLWGLEFSPPASTGSTKYGGQGDWFHFGFWLYLPTGVTLNTNLSDGAQKFILYTSQAQTTGKNDVHICSQSGSFAFINEYDPNAATNNTYPSTRTGTDVQWPRDTWLWVERGTFLHSDGDQAIDRVWVNDDLWLERNGRDLKWRKSDGSYGTSTLGTVGNPSLPSSAGHVEQIFWFTYWNAHPSVDTTIYADGFTMANDRTGFVSDSFGNLMMGTANAD